MTLLSWLPSALIAARQMTAINTRRRAYSGSEVPVSSRLNSHTAATSKVMDVPRGSEKLLRCRTSLTPPCLAFMTRSGMCKRVGNADKLPECSDQAGHGGEHAGDVGAEQADGRDANHGDKGQQQAVFDQGSALFITDELGVGGEKLGHGTFSWSRLGKERGFVSWPIRVSTDRPTRPARRNAADLVLARKAASMPKQSLRGSKLRKNMPILSSRLGTSCRCPT